MKYVLWTLLVILFQKGSFSQQHIHSFIGGWSGKLSSIEEFQFHFDLTVKKDRTCILSVAGPHSLSGTALKTGQYGLLSGMINADIPVKIDINQSFNPAPLGFIQTGHHLSCLNFQQENDSTWTANWNLFLSEEFDPTFYVSIDALGEGAYAASTFFHSPVCHYMYGQEFDYEADQFSFKDIRSGIRLDGQLIQKELIELQMNFLGESISVSLSPLDYDQWEIGSTDKSKYPLSSTSKDNESIWNRLTHDILIDTLEGTHGILAWQDGEFLYEKYFEEFSKDTPHDTRSLSKIFASALLGIAIDQGYLEDEFQLLQDFLGEEYPETDWSDGKDQIKLYHLITMSSGLDAIDFGLNRMSYANEGNYQNQEDWTEYILSAPMVYPPGSHANYGSGNPHLIAPVLSKVLNEDLAVFAHRQLFGPLGITNYRIQTNNDDQPYFGGGWYFTPRDLVKIGRLYLNDGIWEGKQIIPSEWVQKSVAKHTYLENATDQNEYGYLFWHNSYQVNGIEIASVEARGSGGQYLFIVPDYDLVVVITSGNYRNGKGFQPERIMEEYILPGILDLSSKD